jgi:glycosidase
MKKYLMVGICIYLFLTLAIGAQAQRLLSWSPEFPLDNSNLVITVDCNKGNQGLLNYGGGNSADVYVHVGVITNLSTGPSDWKYVKFTWATTDPLAKATALGANKYQYTINNPRSFFGIPTGETIKKVNVIFRNGAGTLKQVNSDGGDMYIPVYAAGEFAVRLNQPPFEPRYVLWPEPLNIAVGGNVAIAGVASANANLTLKLDGAVISTATTAASIAANPAITTACEHKIVLEGNDGNGIKKDSFSFYINSATTVAPLPAGVREGINYAANNTSVTLVLYAPNKNNVIVTGDFTNWATLCSNQMNKTPDGNYYWITINGLTPGTEYGYQYLVDGTIKIADPYAQKILDPNNDPFINATTYPALKPYPTGLTTDLVSVLQTAEPLYNWQVTNFTKPDKKNLVTYELLVRDFTAQHSYQSLIDSMQYFKNLGINAIELMPVNEFSGNESWGYNPNFYFAPDKYYGTKNKLKEFIDKCHQNGIAVILDVVYNQCDNAAPQAKLYWDATNNRPAANNPWLNTAAPHPYSVFNDFNHTSTATQYLVKRSLMFWAEEYKVDGFRFDLAKGFTQTATTTTTVELYDASRVANLKRYYDTVIQNIPNEYMILEFLGSTPAQEEQEYTASGWMVWGNSNPTYNQCTMGYVDNSDIRAMVYNSPLRNFSNPGVMGYSQSHDEERTMYKNLQFGNSAGGYNVKSLATALRQEEAAASVLFTIPGPKMIWQFQERGYDSSINANGGRTANKPPLWQYMTDPNRKALYDAYSNMIKFRLSNPALFNSSSFSYDFNSGLYKIFQIADPAAGGKKITVVANMDVTAQTKSVAFQTTGDWTSVITNGNGTGVNGAAGTSFNVSSATQSITLQPGEYHIYVSVPSCATALPVATSAISYCQNAAAVPLTATGTGLLWYTVASGGTGTATAPTPVTTMVGAVTYYVSQTIGCESARLPINVTVTATTPPPTATSPLTYCINTTATQLTATGTSLLWYTAATGGTGSATAPTPLTTATGNTLYYVSQTQSCGESPRAAITVTVNPVPVPPASLTATNITMNSAVLSWNAIASVYYTVEYKAATATIWSVATITTPGTVAITGLTPATTYNWRASANCTATAINNYTNAQFSTSSHNNNITNIKNGFGIKISPNPFKGSAIIDYIVPGNGLVSIMVMDVYGHRLQSLYNATQNQGQYQLLINSQLTGLAAGCYFIKVEQNGKGYFTKFFKP